MSTETRDRIRALGGETLEETIIEALDAFEAERFWSQAEEAAAWQRDRPTDEQRRTTSVEADIDAAFDGIA